MSQTMMQTMAKTGEIPLQTTKTAGLDFAGLVGQHQSMVFSIALHFLRDRPAAEELAQDVFLQLHHSMAELESADHVTFWLRRVTSHRCIDHARRRKMPAISLDEAATLGPRIIARCLMPFRGLHTECVAQVRVAYALVPHQSTTGQSLMSKLEERLTTATNTGDKRAVFAL